MLIFPDLMAANLFYKLLAASGGARNRPILAGFAGGDDIVNMAVIAAVDAQQRGRRRSGST